MTFSVDALEEDDGSIEFDGDEPDWFEEALKRLEMDRQQLEEETEALKEHYERLVTEDGAAAILICRRKGIDLVEQLKDVDPGLEIENIVEGMNDVRLRCTVLNVYDINQFDGGQVRSIEVKDSSGKTQLSFWDEDAEKVANLSNGDELMVKNGYTKQEMSDYQADRFSTPSVQIGDDAEVEAKDESGEWVALI